MNIYTTKQAAEYLGCHPQNIRHHYYKGTLKGEKMGHSLIFTQKDLESLRIKMKKNFKTDFSKVRHLLGVKTDEDIAQMLGVTAMTVFRYRRDNGIPSTKDNPERITDPR